MKYRITVHFGPFSFAAECTSVAAVFRHIEALVFSPMYEGSQEAREAVCAEHMLMLADIARGKHEEIDNALFSVETIGGKKA